VLRGEQSLREYFTNTALDLGYDNEVVNEFIDIFMSMAKKNGDARGGTMGPKEEMFGQLNTMMQMHQGASNPIDGESIDYQALLDEARRSDSL
jgi:hypothetical protein